MERLAPAHRIQAMSPPQSRKTRDPPVAICQAMKAITRAAISRPLQPAAMSPAGRLSVAFHTRESTTWPPSRGMPGSRLNTPTRALTQTALATTMWPRPSGTTNHRPRATAARTRLATGPATATSALLPGLVLSDWWAVCPPMRSSCTWVTV